MLWNGTHERGILDKAQSYFCAVFAAIVIATPTMPDAAVCGPGDRVFDGIKVHEISLHFAQPAYYDSLLKYYYEKREQCIAALAIMDGVRFDSVGVRLKGNTSFRHPNMKKPMRIVFNAYHKDGRWDGLKSIHLNNCYGDPTFIREKIFLDFCRDAKIAAPRANFANVFINDSLFGFYSLVEHVDKVFLRNHFGNTTGDLFKAIDGVAGGSGRYSDFSWRGHEPGVYLPFYELKTEESHAGWSRLIAVIDTLHGSTTPEASMPAVIQIESFCRAMIADNLLGNLDSYCNGGSNFYFYFNPEVSRFEWIVWDTGMSFGAFTLGVKDAEDLGVFFLKSPADLPLLGRVFDSPHMKARYLQWYCTLFSRQFNSSRLVSNVDAIAGVVRPHVAGDPRKMYTLQEFDKNIESDIVVDRDIRKPGLKSFIRARAGSVRKQLHGLGLKCGETGEK
jgi:hypothetical protein